MAYPAGGNTSPGCGDCVAVDYDHTILKLLVKPTYFIITTQMMSRFFEWTAVIVLLVLILIIVSTASIGAE